MARANDMHDGRHLDAQVYAHAGHARRVFRFWQRVRHLSHPLAALAFDTQQPRRPVQRHTSTTYADLPNLAVLGDGQHKPLVFQAPVLMVPLADGLAQEGNPSQRTRPLPDSAGVPKRLILHGTGQAGGEILGTGALASIGQHVTIQGSHQHVDGADVLLAVCDSARRMAACSGVGERRRTCTVVFNSLTVASRLGLPFDVLLNDLLNDLLAHIAGSAETERARPERRELAQGRERLPQIGRAAPLDELGNVRRQRIRIGTDEQVDMFGLDRQRDNLPIVFMCHLVNKLLQTVMYWPDKHPPTPLVTPDDGVHDKVYTLLLVWYSTSQLHPSSTVSASRKGHSFPG